MQSAESKYYDLEHKPVGKLLVQYMIPAVVGTLVMSLYNIVDRIFIGQAVGSDAISGLALTFPITTLSGAIGMLVGAGSAARISIVLGQKNKRSAEKILGNALVLQLLFCAVYITLFAIYMDDILRMFGGSEVTIPYAREYMIYMLPGMLFLNLCFSFNNMMRASGYPNKAMYTMFIGAILNVILDPIALFALNMGIKGASIATVISMMISTAFVMWHFMSPKSDIKFHVSSFRPDKKTILSILSIGAAPFLINVTSSGVGVIFNLTLSRYGGDTAIGAFGIINTFAMFVVMMIIGLCQGMQPVVGYNYGAKRYDRMKQAYKITVALATIVCLIGWAVAVFMPYYVARAFTVDANLIATTEHGLWISVLILPLIGYQIVSTNLFQSIGMAGTAIFLSLTRQVLFLIPSLYILSNIFQLDGVWCSQPVSDFLATLLTAGCIIVQFKKFKTIEPVS